MSDGWYVYIGTTEHLRGREERTVYEYHPAVIPPGGSIQSREVRYCGHVHRSYDAAKRCGARMKRAAERGEAER